MKTDEANAPIDIEEISKIYKAGGCCDYSCGLFSIVKFPCPFHKLRLNQTYKYSLETICELNIKDIVNGFSCNEDIALDIRQQIRYNIKIYLRSLLRNKKITKEDFLLCVL